MLKRLCGQYGNHVVKYVGWSGIAASNLNNGSTCHHRMCLKVYDADKVRANVENKRATLDRLCRSFLGCKVLVVDKVSMVGCGMPREINSRLREITQCHEAPFQGLCFLLTGDFVQFEIVAQLTLYGGVKCQQGGQDLVDQEGHELFGLFREVCLTKQHRLTGPEHARPVTVDTQEYGCSKEGFSWLKEVTRRDFAEKDEGWEEVTVVSMRSENGACCQPGYGATICKAHGCSGCGLALAKG